MYDSDELHTIEYRVRLEVFEGPLDLLLRLIEREEMDITQVSLARVTDQYLEHVAAMREVDPDDLAEFLVIAAKLLLIKSRVLLPQPEPLKEEEEEEEDVGELLVERLRQYRRFKQIAEMLGAREEAGLRSYARLAPPPLPLERRLEPLEGGAEILAQIMQELLARQPKASPVDKVVAPIRVTMADRMAFIEAAVAERERISFRDLLLACRSRLEIIVTFLAALELMRLLRIQIWQEQPFGEIVISKYTPPPGEEELVLLEPEDEDQEP